MTQRRMFLVAALTAFASLPAVAQSADLAISKVAPYSGSAYAGENTVFQISVTNNGPGTASNVTVTDVLPAGLTYQGADAPSFTCSGPPIGTNGTVSCTAASISPNSSTGLYIFVGVPAGTPGGTTYSNTATISSATSDPTPGNNSATATLTTTGGSISSNDMKMTKIAPTTVTPGGTTNYELSFGSNASTKSNVTVTDTLPAGVTFQSLSGGGPGFTCTTPAVGANGTVQCTTPLMFNTPFAGINIVVKVDPSVPIGTIITNTASVTSTTPDPDTSNNSGSADIVVASPNAADLTISKDAPYPAYAGENTVFRLTAANNGPATASNVTVTDPLPAGLTYQGVYAPGFNCSGPPVGTNGTVSCTAASINLTNPMAIYIFVGIPAGTPGGTSYSNTATISSATSDPVPGNNSANATLTVTGGSAPASDMQMTKTAPTNATPGETMTYTLSFGSSATTKSNVTVTDVLPAGTTFQGVGTAQLGFTCTTPAIGANGTVQCKTPLMFNDPFGAIEIGVQVDPSLPLGTSITNTASVSSTTPDPDTSNNSGSATTVVTSPNSADLAITKAAPYSDSAFAGGNTVFRLNVMNNGPATATNVTITDPLPAGLTYQGVDAPGFTCSGPPIGTNGTVTCTEPSLSLNHPQFLYIFVGIPAGTPGGTSFSNTATISSATTDPVPSNSSATVTFTSAGGPISGNDMQMTKTASATTTPGGTITYQLVFGSNATTTSNVTVTDVLPAGVTFQSVATNNPGYTCTTPAVGANGTVQCSTPLMFLTPFAEIVIVVKVDPSVPIGTSITNTASVSSTTPDPNPSNNTGSATTAVVAAPDLIITKSHSGAFAPGQNGATYTLSVKNIGTAPTSGTVVVNDSLPSGLTATAMSGNGWSCDVGALTCSRTDTLAAGASYPPITLTVNVASNALGTVTNSATVSGGGELIFNNDTANDVTAVIQPAPALDPRALALLGLLLGAIALFRVAGR